MTTFCIFGDGRGNLVARNTDTHEIDARIPSDTTITSATNSHSVVSEIEHLLPGHVVEVEHNGEFIYAAFENPK